MSTWLPGVIVLVFGLAVGIVLAIITRREAEQSAKGVSSDDDEMLRLRITDLRARRDGIYQRLRGEALDDADRLTLELSAARVLKKLDELGMLGKVGGSEPKIPVRTKKEEQPQRRGKPVSAVTGFAWGVGIMSLIALLTYFAMRDATPDPMQEMGMQQPGTQQGGGQQGDGQQVQLPPEVKARLDGLAREVEAAPTDIGKRNVYGHALLEAGLFFESFQESKVVLEQDKNNHEARIHAAVVRFVMGMGEQAEQMLRDVIKEDEKNLEALAYLGVFLAETSRVDEAVTVWTRGLELAGGSHPGFENFLARATGQAPNTPSQEQPSGQPDQSSGPSYQVHVALGDGIQVPDGATLYVYLKPSTGGPPVAARRLPATSFPLDIVIRAEDVMMGGALPTEGTVSARIDLDGNIGTKEDTVAAADVGANAGNPVSLTLQ